MDRKYSRREILEFIGAAGIVAVAGPASRILAQDDVALTVTPRPAATAVTSMIEGEPYPYLSGGTAGMSGEYPNPFLGMKPDATVTCSQTLGPCYADVNLIRQDVTEENPGLPMRLSFLLLDASTDEAIPNASVEIWFTNVEGVYSGETPSNICNGNDAEMAQQAFMRGTQFSDENGIVNFDTVYPGWYPSRTPHIHIRIGLDEQELLVSQIYFPDDLSEFIYTTHPDYIHRGAARVNNEMTGPWMLRIWRPSWSTRSGWRTGRCWRISTWACAVPPTSRCAALKSSQFVAISRLTG